MKYKHTIMIDDSKIKQDNDFKKIAILPPDIKDICIHDKDVETIFISNADRDFGFLSVKDNFIKLIDFSKLRRCNSLIWQNNDTLHFTLNQNARVPTLNLKNNRIQTLDLSSNKIKTLDLSDNQLKEIILPPGLKTLNVSNNLLDEIKEIPQSLKKFIWKFPAFHEINSYWSTPTNENKLGFEQLEELPNLKQLSLHYALSSPSFNENNNFIGSNGEEHLNLSASENLMSLDLIGVYVNGDIILNRRNSKLQVFKLENSDIQYLILPENLSNLKVFDYISCNNQTTIRDINDFNFLKQITNETQIKDPKRLHTLGLSFDFFTTFLKTPNIKRVFIKKSIFKINSLPVALANNKEQNPFIFRFNHSLEQLTLNNIKIKTNDGIVPLRNIEFYGDEGSKLKTLDLSENGFTNIDLSRFPKLKKLFLNDNPLLSIDISNLKNLEELNIHSTKIKRIDISNNSKLKRITVNTSTEVINSSKTKPEIIERIGIL